MPRESREFEVVLFGATGFTGRLVADYLCRAPHSARWALAGRSAAKLEELRLELASRHPAAAGLQYIVADASDPKSLRSMAERTRVVCTTAGPYARHGSALVAACVAAETDYCDLCGEVQWMRQMIDTHHEHAQ